MLENRIKKIVKTIYKFDFSESELVDGRELVTENNVSEFATAFGRKDLDHGIIVTPSGYKSGFVYKNNDELYVNMSQSRRIGVAFAISCRYKYQLNPKLCIGAELTGTFSSYSSLAAYATVGYALGK